MAQYKLVKMGSDSNGPTVIEEDTVLDIQKGGVLGVPWGASRPVRPNMRMATSNLLRVFAHREGGAAAGHGLGLLKSRIPGASSAPSAIRPMQAHGISIKVRRCTPRPSPWT